MNVRELARERPVVFKPAHVPDSLVYDFDFVFDPGLVADPHARAIDLARGAPAIFWTPRQEGHWVLIGHAANFEAARRWRIFSSEMIPQQQLGELLKAMPAGAPRIPQPVPQSLDPPQHSTYRVPLNSIFSPNVVSRLIDRIRDAADECVGAVAGEGGCDFMSEVAERLPVDIFLKMMGLPPEKRPQYQEMLRQKLAGAGLADVAGTTAKLIHIASVMRETITARRLETQDDIISLLWSIEIEGRAISLEEMEDYGVLLFLAGLDTVMNAMGYMVLHLARNPGLQEQLRADPSQIGRAVEELLRLYTFVALPRRITEDCEFQGVSLKAGERALLYLPAANLDAAVFDEPARFDMHRENRAHIAFNAGPHRCVGLHLARAELVALCEALLAKLPLFRLKEGSQPTYRAGYTLGIATLPIEWDPVGSGIEG